MRVDLFLNVFDLACSCIQKSQCTALSWCSLVCCVISWSWIRSSVVISALRSTRRRVLCSRIIRASSAFNSKRFWTPSSACQRSSALKRDIALPLLAYAFLFGFFIRWQIVLLTIRKRRSVLHLDVVKLFVHRAAHRGSREFIIVVFAGPGNL